jgi:hypothetical protein
LSLFITALGLRLRAGRRREEGFFSLVLTADLKVCSTLLPATVLDRAAFLFVVFA